MRNPLWKMDFETFKRLFYEEQWPLKEIAQHFNMSVSGVVSFRQRRNLPPRGWASGIHPNSGKIQKIHPMLGKKHSPAAIAKMKQVMLGKFVGEKNWRWKGGKYTNHWGYVRIQVEKNEPYALEHRHVMEQHIGRKLKSSEHVHHKNEIKTDNRIENLEILTSSEHAKLHFPKGSHFGINS